MPGQKNRRPTYGLRWGMVSMLLILALVLPSAQPSAVAQACQGDDCPTADASATPANSDPESDVAILQVEAEGLTAIPIADSDIQHFYGIASGANHLQVF